MYILRRGFSYKILIYYMLDNQKEKTRTHTVEPDGIITALRSWSKCPLHQA